MDSSHYSPVKTSQTTEMKDMASYNATSSSKPGFTAASANVLDSTNSTRESLARPTLGQRHLSFIDPTVLDKVGAVNRRLLPNCKNSLHVIDGPECRYYLGIIDFFTKWECRQRTARVLKSFRYCCGDHSTIPPPAYAERFKRFIHEHVA